MAEAATPKSYPAVETAHSMEKFLQLLAAASPADFVLFRGQPEDLPLIPKLGRPDTGFTKLNRHLEEVERDMLEVFRTYLKIA